MLKLRAKIFLCLVALLCAVPAFAEDLKDGVYLVVREGETPVLDTKDYIPLVMGSAPEKKTDSRGHAELLLQLAQDQVKPLEEFTRKNLNRTIAVVVNGDVVSTHKIKEPITGGRMQITRCTDNKCEVIYTQLIGKMESKDATIPPIP